MYHRQHSTRKIRHGLPLLLSIFVLITVSVTSVLLEYTPVGALTPDQENSCYSKWNNQPVLSHQQNLNGSDKYCFQEQKGICSVVVDTSPGGARREVYECHKTVDREFAARTDAAITAYQQPVADKLCSHLGSNNPGATACREEAAKAVRECTTTFWGSEEGKHLSFPDINSNTVAKCVTGKTGGSLLPVIDALSSANAKEAVDTVIQDYEVARDESTCFAQGGTWDKDTEKCSEGTDSEQLKTCGTEVTGIGWIMCPITTAGILFADTVWALFEALLDTPPLHADGSGSDNGAYYATWKNIRDLANILFVLVFLLVIFSQISNIGISNYGIKKMLPRLLIAAVAINISFFIVQIAVDLSNALGSTVLGVFNNLPAVTEADGKLGWEHLLDDLLAGGIVGGITLFGGAALAGAGMLMPILMFLALLLIPAVVGILAGVAALIVRSALVPIIAIFAPLAIVAYIFPNGQSLFDKWRKTFTSLLLLYPLSAIYFGALKFTAAIMINGEGLLERMVGHGLLFIGCFVVLGIALKGNAIVGKVYGAVQGGINKVASPLQKVGMGVAGATMALQFANFKNRNHGPAPTRRKFDPRRITDRIGVAGIGRSLQKFDDNKLTRQMATENAKDDAQDRLEKAIIGNYDPHDPKNTLSKEAIATANGNTDDAQVLVERLIAKSKKEKREKHMTTLSREFAMEKAAGRNTDDFLADRALTATNEDARDAAIFMAAQYGRDGVISRIQAAPSYAANESLRVATEEAIASNVSALGSKAPHLVKGAASAFRNVKGSELANFSPTTMRAYMDYLANVQNTPEDPNAQTESVQAFLGAQQAIARDSTLSATWGPDVRAAMRTRVQNNHPNATNPAFGTIHTALNTPAPRPQPQYHQPVGPQPAPSDTELLAHYDTLKQALVANDQQAINDAHDALNRGGSDGRYLLNNAYIEHGRDIKPPSRP